MADVNSLRSKLYEHLEATIDELADHDPAQRATGLANVALAFRYAYGGQQPGGFPKD